jgi:multiple sugar transport system permease protein
MTASASLRLRGKVFLHLLLAAGAVTMILPFLWMLSTSLKPEAQIFRFPPVWIPSRWEWSNYTRSMEAAPFGRYFLNTIIFSAAVTLSNLLFCSMAAYAFARLRFRGRNVLFILVLGTMMIPAQVTMVPVFVMLKHWPLTGGNDLLGAGGHGLLNSYVGLVLPGAVGAFGIFLLRQFFMTLPRELEDAARIDGCSELGIYWRIILPLSKPALATLGIFTFTAAWNEFLWPLLITSKDSMRTLQLGVQVFQTQYTTSWDLLMAATVLITLPVLVIFLAGQRYFTRGIALSGMKG